MELPFFLLPSLLLLLSFLYSLTQFLKPNPPREPGKPTVLKTYPIVGSLPYLIKNGHRLLDWVAEIVPASPTATVTVAPLVFTANPANVEHITKSRFARYPKSDSNITTFHDFLGRGIFNANGEVWLLQRKAASFEFSARSLRSFVNDRVRVELSDRLLPRLRKASEAGEVLDLQEVLERFAFDNTCGLVFGEDPKCLTGESEEGERFFRAFVEATHLSIDRAKEVFPARWKLNKWLGIGSERRLGESLAVVHRHIEAFVRSRKKRGGAGGCDFLSRLVEDESHSEEFLRDILISFVIAGRDTTPSALTWFFWVLASRPDVVRKIRAELRSVRPGRDGEVVAVEQAREMEYLHAAITESMRLYPPVPLMPRECAEGDELPDGTAVRKGWTVMYSAYAMGRTAAVWGEDCMEYRPERWMATGEDGVLRFQPASPFRYPVFHAGPRMCLGKEMAYVQLKAVAAAVLEDFDLEVVSATGKYQLSMTMGMEGGLQVRVRERSRGAEGVR